MRDPLLPPTFGFHSACVTGAAGLLGRRLVARLSALGVERVIALDASCPPVFPAATESVTEIVPVRASVLEQHALAKALRDCEVVFHLAGIADVGLCAGHPASAFEVNVLGTVHVLDACRLSGVRSVMLASTGLVYGSSPGDCPIGEDTLPRPLSVYAASKLAAESVAAGFARGYRSLSVTVARFANLYGAGSKPDTVIGRALRQAAVGGPIRLRDLAARRDFLHVDDAADAMLRLAAFTSAGDFRILNVGSGTATTIRQMADTLASVAGRLGLGPVAVAPAEGQPQEKSGLLLDIRRVQQAVAWKPHVTLADGLERSLSGVIGRN